MVLEKVWREEFEEIKNVLKPSIFAVFMIYFCVDYSFVCVDGDAVLYFVHCTI